MTTTSKLYYSECRIMTSHGGNCPMCNAALVPMVQHTCSNPDPILTKKRQPRKKASPAKR